MRDEYENTIKALRALNTRQIRELALKLGVGQRTLTKIKSGETTSPNVLLSIDLYEELVLGNINHNDNEAA